MQVVRIHEHPAVRIGGHMRNASVAIGNFDGVHLGHQQVISAAQAARPDAPLGVVTFEPHPSRFFRPDIEPFRLTPEAQKLRRLAACGVDITFIIDFNAELAAQSAESFAADLLGGAFGITHICAGADFHFGKDRKGDLALLGKIGEKTGFTVSDVPLLGNGVKYSSSGARAALKAGNPKGAAFILGRAHSIDGPVIRGDQRGRQIDFPTLNIPLNEALVPKLGVYAVRVEGIDPALPPIEGVANIGMRPTFSKTEPLLEVHLFDLSGDFYGAEVSVTLIDFIRPERKFDGLESLKAQIERDVETAREMLEAPALSGYPRSG